MAVKSVAGPTERLRCEHCVLIKTRKLTRKCSGCRSRKWPWSKALGCVVCKNVWHEGCAPRSEHTNTIAADKGAGDVVALGDDDVDVDFRCLSGAADATEDVQIDAPEPVDLVDSGSDVSPTNECDNVENVDYCHEAAMDAAAAAVKLAAAAVEAVDQELLATCEATVTTNFERAAASYDRGDDLDDVAKAVALQVASLREYRRLVMRHVQVVEAYDRAVQIYGEVVAGDDFVSYDDPDCFK